MHSLAIGNDGALYAWGSADNGQLGIGRVSVAQLLPVRVNNLGALWGIPIISTGNDSTRLPDGSFRLRFKTDLNRTYQIQYSDDTETWKTASSMLTGNGQTLEWIDDGPESNAFSHASKLGHGQVLRHSRQWLWVKLATIFFTNLSFFIRAFIELQHLTTVRVDYASQLPSG